MPSYFVSIYRDADGVDCTINGVSNQHRRAILYRGDVPENHPKDYAALVLDEKPITICARTVARVRAVPVGETHWTMFGGNFIWSCDSRFRQEVSEYPIAVHDRIES